jgi:hypothetical protein
VSPFRHPSRVDLLPKNTFFLFFLQGAGRVPRFGTQPRWQRYAKTHFANFFTRGGKGAPLRNPAPLAEVRKNTFFRFFKFLRHVVAEGWRPLWESEEVGFV